MASCIKMSYLVLADKDEILRVPSDECLESSFFAGIFTQRVYLWAFDICCVDALCPFIIVF